MDTAEVYAIPSKAETAGLTETYIGNWFAKNLGKREDVGAADITLSLEARMEIDKVFSQNPNPATY